MTEEDLMTSRTKLMRKDIVVVLTCTAFALLCLGAVGAGGRKRAKEAVCLSNLRQWGAIFQVYTADNDGYFCSSNQTIGWRRGAWILPFRFLFETRTKLLLCPEATHPRFDSSEVTPQGGPFNAYIVSMGGFEDRRETAAYGANAWIYNTDETVQGRPASWHWKSCRVQDAHDIPVFLDSMWRGGGPVAGSEPDFSMSDSKAVPPSYNGQWSGAGYEMKHFCIDRHNGAINALFMDWSARKIGLKELWTLKWHRQFDAEGPWTKAGGIQPINWPEWMRNFKDY